MTVRFQQELTSYYLQMYMSRMIPLLHPQFVSAVILARDAAEVDRVLFNESYNLRRRT